MGKYYIKKEESREWDKKREEVVAKTWYEVMKRLSVKEKFFSFSYFLISFYLIGLLIAVMIYPTSFTWVFVSYLLIVFNIVKLFFSFQLNIDKKISSFKSIKGAENYIKFLEEGKDED